MREYHGWLNPKGKFIYAPSSHWNVLPKRLREMGDGCIPSFTDLGWVWVNDTEDGVWFECNEEMVPMVREFVHKEGIPVATIAILKGYKEKRRVEI